MDFAQSVPIASLQHGDGRIRRLDTTSAALIDISGGTYFPGAKSASDAAGSGPYFLTFARRARDVTTKPLMITGGFNTWAQAEDAVGSGVVDVVGLARALLLDPEVPNRWLGAAPVDPAYPRFDNPPEDGVTAWYTMRLTALGEGRDGPDPADLPDAIAA